jgi:bifunctional non-homologous end joining protein LigD
MANESGTVPADARDWRPQVAKVVRGAPYIDNAIAEPFWSGTRVLVLFRESEHADEFGSVEVIDETGADALSLAHRAFDQLRRSISASEAIVDGVVTAQTLDSGVSMEFDEYRGQLGQDLAFVALDLLRVDGQELLDVPLLERKRLLEGAIFQSPLVRLSPWVRPPINAWLRTWTGAGFKGAMVKSSNSRYELGSTTLEWAFVEGFGRR